MPLLQSILNRMGEIFLYYVSNGTVKTKIQETSQPLSMMYASDLEWTSLWDGLLCDNIYKQLAVRYCHTDLSVGGSGCPNSNSGHYTAKHMLSSIFLIVISVCCSPDPIRFRFKKPIVL